MKTLFQLGKILGTLAVLFVWLFVVVVQVPLLLTAGGVQYFVGIALGLGSVVVLIFMVWKILSAKFNQLNATKE